jgi:hypothetical protein
MRMPPLGHISAARQETYRLCNGGVEHIQPVVAVGNLGQYTSLCILNTHQMRTYENLILQFVELADAQDTHLQLGDEIDAGDESMFTVLALKDNGPAHLDAYHRTVAELDGATDARVELQEGAARTCHVVRRAGIHHPPGSVDLRIIFNELCKDFVLHKMNRTS